MLPFPIRDVRHKRRAFCSSSNCASFRRLPTVLGWRKGWLAGCRWSPRVFSFTDLGEVITPQIKGRACLPCAQALLLWGTAHLRFSPSHCSCLMMEFPGWRRHFGTRPSHVPHGTIFRMVRILTITFLTFVSLFCSLILTSSRAGVLKVWFVDRQDQQHLGTSRLCSKQLKENLWGVEPVTLNKPSRWLSGVLKFEKCSHPFTACQLPKYLCQENEIQLYSVTWC